ncbi:hypothetical protein IC762_22655 [Bradyrhizobium genosp. L]|nr:hypothetical protein [Bradyrhizobium genosp. L]QPF82548.1 hypothetical protein IC762_22655 [Bradyrhizobium genosp. L]
MSKATGSLPSAQTARAEKQRLAKEEGARAIADVAKQDAAIRTNMARLRELRLAKESAEPIAQLKPKPRPKR